MRSMIEISYFQMLVVISAAWIAVRAIICIRNKRLDIRRELALIPVYICIVVVVRFTFCPFGKVDGRIQPLLFDAGKIFPLWINFVPFVHLFDYPTVTETLLNLVGNTAMFVPLGIIWPTVFRKLDTHGKVITAGVGVSVCIEVLQLPFFGRATDIDDLLLNSAGFLIGYGMYLLVKRITARVRSGR